MKKLDLTCPCCAAQMTLEEAQGRAVCEYCGHQIVLEKKETAEDIKKREEAKSYGYYAGKHKAEEEKQQREKKQGLKGKIIAGVIFVLLGLVGLAYTHFSMPLLEDPFAYLEVSFVGEDGDGELVMKVNNNAPGEIDMARVRFQCEKDEHLCEGETIVIEAVCQEYRMGTTTKRYTVEGLDCYLKDVQALNESQLEVFFEDNKAIQTRNVEYILEEDEELQITPIRLVCYQNGTANTIYMISEVSFEITDKKYYTVSEWEDVVVNRANGNLDLSYGMYWGNLTSVESWKSAMLYDTLKEAVREVESQQSGQDEVSILELE